MEAFNERHGTTKKRSKITKSVAEVHSQESELDEELGSPEPKKCKESLSSALESPSSDSDSHKKQMKPQKESPLKSPIKSSPASSIVLPSPSKNGEKSISEASDTNTEKHESDTAGSSVSETSTKKKSKKNKKSKEIQAPEKPSSSVFEYFAANVHTGKAKKAKKAFRKLSKKEMKSVKLKYNEIVETYVAQLKAYLATLPRDEAISYVSINISRRIDFMLKENVVFCRLQK